MDKEIFILLVDNDGTMRSSCQPFGYAVEDEEEAKKFVALGGGYFRSYEKNY